MSRPAIKPTKIYGWDGIELSNDELSVGLTPSIGGRIMSLKYQGQEMLFVDPLHTGETFSPQDWRSLSEAKKKMGFRVWGGDKTWVAPQSSWLEGIPPLDLDAAPYALTLTEHEVQMSSPVCRETGLQIIRHVSLIDGKVRLCEELHNRSSQAVSRGLWNVTQVKRPCLFEIPAKNETFRSYHHEDRTLPAFQGSLACFNERLTIDCTKPSLFKVGGNPLGGAVMIYVMVNDQKLAWKKEFNYQPSAQYAHDSAVEIFNSPTLPYAEIELHAPFSTLAPHQFVRLEQTWQISACSSKV